MMPAKYDDLDYTPVRGAVDIRGHESEWSVAVSVEQGRAMERDGIPVFWVHSEYPEWVVNLGMVKLWGVLFRIWTFPQRATKKGKE